MFSGNLKIESTHSVIYYLMLKCPVVNGFAAYISISASTWQSYSLWMRFRAILHFVKVLVFLMNDSFHVDVCC